MSDCEECDMPGDWHLVSCSQPRQDPNADREQAQPGSHEVDPATHTERGDPKQDRRDDDEQQGEHDLPIPDREGR